MIRPQLTLTGLHDEMIVDNFAGGGGASSGIYWALGRGVDLAVNHDRKALGMHRINHPETVHLCEDVFDVNPWEACNGRKVGYAHFSPDCKHHSKAKGGKPVDKRIRGLVLVMLRWAKGVRPRVMSMENVEEIVDWGPLVWMLKGGKWGWHPDPAHKGRTWRAFLACMTTGIAADHPDLMEILEVCGGLVTYDDCRRGFGYHFEGRNIRASDHDTPTIRRRFFAYFRCDGRPIVWPAPTHAKVPTGKLKPWRPIAECIDWTLPCPSIFLTKEEAKAWKCKRPLVTSTLKRIATGIDRYVLKAKRPFLVSLTHQGGERVESIDEPARTITGAHRGEKAVVGPVLQKFHGSHAGRTDGETRNYPVTDPLLVQDTEPRFALTEASLAPFLTEHANASAQRTFAADEPMRTQCGEVKGGHFAAITPVMVNTANGKFDESPSRCHSVEGGLGPVTGTQKFAVVTGTVVGAGGRAAQSRARSLDESLHTTTAKADTCLASTTLVPYPEVVPTFEEWYAATKDHGGTREEYNMLYGLDPEGLQRNIDLASALIIGAGGPTYSGKPKSVEVPMNAQTTENHAAVVGATLVQTGYGERAPEYIHRCGMVNVTCKSRAKCRKCGKTPYLRQKGQTPRALDPAKPLGIIVAGACKHGLAAASMVKLRGDNVGDAADAPAHTVSAGGTHHGVVAATLMRQFGNSIGQEVDTTGPTVMPGGGGKTGLVSAFLAQHNGGFNETPGHPATDPASTISSKGSQQQVVAASIAAYYGSERDGQGVDEPMRAATTKPRLAHVESTAVCQLTPEQIAGALRVAAFLRAHGVEFEGPYATVAGYVIVDIGMRMLTPRELFRAQGFPESYVIDRAWLIDPKTGSLKEAVLTKEEQIRMCGNSVCPPVMKALVEANVPELAVWYKGEKRARDKRLAVS